MTEENSWSDADLDAAVDAAVLATTRNTRQSCVAANRFLVQKGVFEEFVARLAQRLDGLSVGDGSVEPVADLGPMIDRRSVVAIQQLVDEALSLGATERTADRDVPEKGAFLRPMLLTGVPEKAGLARSEVFGPVAAALPFTDEDDSIHQANRTEVGLPPTSSRGTPAAAGASRTSWRPASSASTTSCRPSRSRRWAP